MILRQLFDSASSTYTYLMADEVSHEAVIIDPVKDQIHHYLKLLNELELDLKFALDTHVHADHITALGELREHTHCVTMVGSSGDIACASEFLEEGKKILIGSITIQTIFTPGHTDDSYCFFIDSGSNKINQSYLFSGDTLLIRGTGRTDFQNGDPSQLYSSIHQKIMSLPPDTILLPAHDYKGWTSSTLAEEKAHNPRLQLSLEDFINHMNTLNLPDPKLMDVAVPANMSCGKIGLNDD